jgi:hypothetical protein
VNSDHYYADHRILKELAELDRDLGCKIERREPAAMTSPRSGMVITPSGRTRKLPETAPSFQTSTAI